MLENVDAIIFDVDGVLMDASQSFPQAVMQSVPIAWEKLLKRRVDRIVNLRDHYGLAKTYRGFNDDYDVSWTLLSLMASKGLSDLSLSLPSLAEWKTHLEKTGDDGKDYFMSIFGDFPPRHESRKICAELYYGEKTMMDAFKEEPVYCKGAPGLWRQESPLLGLHWSKLGLPVAIYTGRFTFELELAFKNLGWQDFPKNLIITPDHGYKKPSPLGLEILSQRMGACNPVFLGDTNSDYRAYKNFGVGYFIGIGSQLAQVSPLNFEKTEDAVRFIMENATCKT